MKEERIIEQNPSGASDFGHLQSGIKIYPTDGTRTHGYKYSIISSSVDSRTIRGLFFTSVATGAEYKNCLNSSNEYVKFTFLG